LQSRIESLETELFQAQQQSLSDARIRAEHEALLTMLQRELQERSVEISHCQDELSKASDVVKSIPEISDSELRRTLPLCQVLSLLKEQLAAEQSKLQHAQQVTAAEQQQLQHQLDKAKEEQVSVSELLRESEQLRAELLNEIADVRAQAENSSKMFETVKAQLDNAQAHSIDLGAQLDGVSASRR
jgi:hypothetical protein